MTGNLRAHCNTAYGWCVVDSTGGVWWPDYALFITLAGAKYPASHILRMCRTRPTRGKWSH